MVLKLVGYTLRRVPSAMPDGMFAEVAQSARVQPTLCRSLLDRPRGQIYGPTRRSDATSFFRGVLCLEYYGNV